VEDQISFLDEVAASPRTMQRAEQVVVEVWTKVEYVLNHHRGHYKYKKLSTGSFVIPWLELYFVWPYDVCPMNWVSGTFSSSTAYQYCPILIIMY
jgi:hypothetical protein